MKRAAFVGLGLCGLAALSISGFVARNVLLDSATSEMKAGLFESALPKLRLLAHLSDSTAQSLLGDSYAYGWGLARDRQKAIYWYRRAAPHNVATVDPAAPAMFYVGKRYLESTGRMHDEKEARKWFEWSAKGGFKPASEKLKELQTSS